MRFTGWGAVAYGLQELQWNLYKATTELCGLSKEVAFQGRENKHDCVKTVRQMTKFIIFSKTSLVSLYRFHCIINADFNSTWSFPSSKLNILKKSVPE